MQCSLRAIALPLRGLQPLASSNWHGILYSTPRDAEASTSLPSASRFLTYNGLHQRNDLSLGSRLRSSRFDPLGGLTGWCSSCRYAGLPAHAASSHRAFSAWSAGQGLGLNLTFTNCMIGINLLTYAAQVLTNNALTAKLMKSSWHIDHGELWRLITPVFLHADLFHLLINSYSLYNLGNSLEPISGMPRFATVYFFSTLTGNLCSYLLHQGNSVGASTALFGLLGAEAVLYLRNGQVFVNSSSNLQNIMLMIGINAAYGFSNPRIDNSGHFGGLVGGVLAAWLLGPAYVRGNWGRWEDRPPWDIFGKKK